MEKVIGYLLLNGGKDPHFFGGSMWYLFFREKFCSLINKFGIGVSCLGKNQNLVGIGLIHLYTLSVAIVKPFQSIEIEHLQTRLERRWMVYRRYLIYIYIIMGKDGI